MGWARTLLLGDVGNRLDIEDTEHEIRRLKHDLRGKFRKDMSQDQQIEALADENAELKLYVVSLIRLLSRKGVVTADELEAMVECIDAEDGESNGRYDGPLT